jgi:hypothetical protein
VEPTLCSGLTEKSLKFLLNQVISFQGRMVALSDLIHPDQSLSPLKPCKLSDLLNKSPIEDHLSTGRFNADCYIPRKVKRSTKLKPDIVDDWKEGKFKDELVFNERDFLETVAKFPGKNIHWLEKLGSEMSDFGRMKSDRGDLKYKWIKSHNKITTLLRYRDEKGPDELTRFAETGSIPKVPYGPK